MTRAGEHSIIRPADCSGDAQAICDIYNYYIENTTATFEEQAISLENMEARIKKISGQYPYLVQEDNNEITGYAYANIWKERSAYRNSAEISIYLKNGNQGKGKGQELLDSLIREIRKTKLHVLIAGITMPNERSIRLFEKSGFSKIGHFREVGFKNNRWLDVGYWELIV